MDIKKIQQRLVEHGRDPGPVDGILGHKTYHALFDYMAGRPLIDRGEVLARGAVSNFPAYSIDSALRLAHLLAQATHETANFCHFKELWGPTPQQKRYEGRADIGNTEPGDGFRYRGRGIFQITGRFNYHRVGKALGLPLEENPDLAADPEISVRIACHYWMTHGINAAADADDVEWVTRLINGGRNGLDARKRALVKAKIVLL